MSKFYLQFQILSIIIAITFAADYLTEKPDYLTSCKINDPSFAECLTNTVQGLFNQVTKAGIPGLQDFPVVDPYKVNKIKINQGGDGPVNIKVELSDMSVMGFQGAIVNESRVNPEDYSWDIKIFLPNVKMGGDYTVEGRVLVIPLNGQGKIYLEAESMDITITTKITLYEKDSFTFYNVTGISVDYTVQGLKVKMGNLFNGNQELEDNANALFNENWQYVAENVKPVIKEAIEQVLLDIFRRTFNFVPANFFVEDIPQSTELYR